MDCDPGYDDAVALVLANRWLDVKGITTVAGNAPLAQTTTNALGIVELLQMNAEVHSGSERPLRADPSFATEIHGSSGLDGVSLPSHDRGLTSMNAVEYLLDSAEEDLWVVALGPLTNIAHVLLRYPDWINQIAGLSIMGGSIHGGNVTPAAEFNIYFDPEAGAVVMNAANILLRGASTIRMCGLNLTHQIQVTPEELNAYYERSEESSVYQFSRECLKGLMANVTRFTGVARAAMHDPCAILAVSHSGLMSFTKRSIEVEVDGTLTRGMTVVDSRERAQRVERGVEVGYEVDVDAVKEVMFDTLFPIT